jgi:GMP synthase (glutamine-hydrolysing)
VDRLAILRDADFIVRQEVNRNHIYHQLWQAFAVLLPIRSVGVMGINEPMPILLYFVL